MAAAQGVVQEAQLTRVHCTAEPAHSRKYVSGRLPAVLQLRVHLSWKGYSIS